MYIYIYIVCCKSRDSNKAFQIGVGMRGGFPVAQNLARARVDKINQQAEITIAKIVRVVIVVLVALDGHCLFLMWEHIIFYSLVIHMAELLKQRMFHKRTVTFDIFLVSSNSLITFPNS